MPDEKKVAENIAMLTNAAQTEPIVKFLGAKLLELTPGYAKVTMELKPEFQNFNGYVFGGIVMSLADLAFGYGSNSLAHPSVATDLNVNFISAAGPSDTLIAECRVLRSGKRAGISQISVTNQDGKMIAVATGVTVPVGE